jgi:hypothetical protein
MNADTDAPPLFRRASQNLAAAAMLLRGCPEAATSKERQVCQQLKALLEAAVLMVKFRQPSHEFTFSVGMSFISYPLVLTSLV